MTPLFAATPHGQLLCFWCGLVPATTEVVATPSCQSCADAGPKVRVQRALLRWKESAGR